MHYVLERIVFTKNEYTLVVGVGMCVGHPQVTQQVMSFGSYYHQILNSYNMHTRCCK